MLRNFFIQTSKHLIGSGPPLRGAGSVSGVRKGVHYDATDILVGISAFVNHFTYFYSP